MKTTMSRFLCGHLDRWALSVFAAVIIALTFLFRLYYINSTVVDIPLRGDAGSYFIYAKNLLEHGVFSKDTINAVPEPDSFWAPGYPFFLAVVMKFTSSEQFYSAVLYTQAFISALTAGISVVLGSFFLPVWGCLLIAFLLVFSPHMTSMAGYLLTETLFCFTLAMSLLLFILALKKQQNLLHCLSGLFFGLSYLVNPVIFFFPFIATLVVYYFFNENKLKKQNILLFLGCFLLIFALWSVRGMVSVKGESDSSLDRAETNFIIGSHSDFYDIWRKNPRDESLPKAWEMAREEPLGKILGDVMRRVAADPVHYSYWYFIEKPYLLWSWNILTGQGDIYIYPVVTYLHKHSRLAILSYSLS